MGVQTVEERYVSVVTKETIIIVAAVILDVPIEYRILFIAPTVDLPYQLTLILAVLGGKVAIFRGRGKLSLTFARILAKIFRIPTT